jgi:hypothetical protein
LPLTGPDLIHEPEFTFENAEGRIGLVIRSIRARDSESINSCRAGGDCYRVIVADACPNLIVGGFLRAVDRFNAVDRSGVPGIAAGEIEDAPSMILVAGDKNEAVPPSLSLSLNGGGDVLGAVNPERRGELGAVGPVTRRQPKAQKDRRDTERSKGRHESVPDFRAGQRTRRFTPFLREFGIERPGARTRSPAAEAVVPKIVPIGTIVHTC